MGYNGRIKTVSSNNGACIFNIGGLSGAGKSTIFRTILGMFPDQVRGIPRTTTRSPRPGEIDGVDAIFISNRFFDQQADAGQLIGIETDEETGNRYAIDTQNIHAAQPNHNSPRLLLVGGLSGTALKTRFPDVMSIFISASDAEITARLEDRYRNDPQTLYKRLHWINGQKLMQSRFDIVIENHNSHLGESIAAILALMRLPALTTCSLATPPFP